MAQDIDVLLGLMIEAKETDYNPAVIIEKANWFNIRATQKQRKDLILPIVQARDPGQVLRKKVSDYLAASKLKRGIH